MGIGPINFSGLASGLDVNGLITAILKPRQSLIDFQTSRGSTLATQKAAFDKLQSALSDLRAAAESLGDAGTIDARTGTTSDASIATATVDATAVAGVHTLVVSAFAAADRRRSAGVADASSGLVADGTITLRSGGGDTITVNVAASSGNNTLNAVRDAINGAGKGIRASVVNNGASAILVVEAEKTGTANSLTITDTTHLNLAAAGNVVQAAANAALTVDGIAITSASNVVTGALEGVTISLQKAAPASSVTLTVGRDGAALKQALTDYVAAYNKAADFFSAQTARGGAGTAGPLAGDSTVRSLESTLQGFSVSGVSGLSTAVLRSLGQIGVSLDGKTGQLSLDGAAFDKAFQDRPDEFQALLADAGSSDTGLVSFSTAGAATKEGTYAVQVTTAAEQAIVSAGTAVGVSGLSAAENLTITAGGSTVQVALTAWTTLSGIVTAVNSALRAAGAQAAADDNAGRLRVRSLGFGSAATVRVVSDVADAGNGLSTGFGTTPLTDSGVDVVGTLAGVAATGVGRTLSGAAGTDVEGLSVETTGTGALGNVTFTRGIASAVSLALKGIVDPFDGPIVHAQKALQDGIDSIGDRVTQLQASLGVEQEILLRKFTAMEQTLQSLQGTLASLGGTGA
ncbi:MAG TPA: flagellar filament capping protein FliD [Verrucomicrobiae bacterium]|nr:flagellar filament capping protein FliD [Verrucomicrobiae bacterium]